jgi:hypothetical protein
MNKNLKVGDSVKITGGKYKKFGTGVLYQLKPTYCDVDFNENGRHKVKVDYIFPIDDLVIDMPEAEQLQDVGQDPDDFIAENPELIKMEDLHPDEEEFASLEEKITELEEKANYYISEASVFEAERDQADKKVLEQDEIIDRLTKRNRYLEELCRKILLP